MKAIVLIRDTREISDLFDEFIDLRDLVERTVDRYDFAMVSRAGSKGKRGTSPLPRQTTRVFAKLHGAWGTAFVRARGKKRSVVVETLEFASARLAALGPRLLEAQRIALGTEASSAFVQFRSLTLAAVARQTRLDEDVSVWQTQQAPERDEVIWWTLRLRGWERQIRAAASVTLYVFLIVVFMVPVTFVQGFVSPCSVVPSVRQSVTRRRGHVSTPVMQPERIGVTLGPSAIGACFLMFVPFSKAGAIQRTVDS